MYGCYGVNWCRRFLVEAQRNLPKRLFCVFGGIGKESSTINCSSRAKHSISTYTYDWRKASRIGQWLVWLEFHQDKTRQRKSLTRSQKLRELGREIISQPPYILDLIQSAYDLFKRLQNSVYVKLATSEDCKNELIKFLLVGMRISSIAEIASKVDKSYQLKCKNNLNPKIQTLFIYMQKWSEKRFRLDSSSYYLVTLNKVYRTKVMNRWKNQSDNKCFKRLKSRLFYTAI